MNPRLVRTSIVACLAFAGCSESSSAPPGGPPPAPGWSLLANGPVRPDRNHHQDIWFISPDSGWLVDIDGQVFRTGDGGATWSLIHTEAGRFLRSVGFATNQHGFIGNLNDFNTPQSYNSLFETLDGGVTLTNVTSRVVGPEPVGICGMWVLDANTIFAAGRWSGPAVFLKTTDGGATWTSKSLAPDATGAVDIYFKDAMHGLIVGGQGVGNSPAEQNASHTVILGTVDGGATWQVRFLSSVTGTWAWKISFPNDTVGYVAVQGPAPAGIVIKTVDGGMTWHEIVTGANAGFSGIGFATQDTGWVAASHATYQTVDGGDNWTKVHFSADTAGEDLNRFRMLSPHLGYAIGLKTYKFTH